MKGFLRNNLLTFFLLLILLAAVATIGHVRPNFSLPKVNLPKIPQSSPQANSNPSYPTNNLLTQRGASNQTVFVLGGQYLDPISNQITATNSSEYFNFVKDKWSMMPLMNNPHDGAASAAYASKIYVFGGQSSQSVEEFDPAVNKWVVVSNLPNPHFLGQAISLGGKIYILGGQGIPGGSMNNKVDVYDPISNSWSLASNIPILTEFYTSSCGPLAGKIFCPGIGQYAYTLVYDPLINSWSSLPTEDRKIPVSISWLTSDKGLLALDSQSGPQGKDENSLLSYDINTDSIVTTGLKYYIHPSYQGFGSAVFDDFALLMGGIFTGNPVKDVYILSPIYAPVKWEKTTPLNIGRTYVSSVILPITYEGKALNLKSIGQIGGIITTNGVPAVGKEVILQGPDDFTFGPRQIAYTDQNGKYFFNYLTPGRYELTVQRGSSQDNYGIPIYKNNKQEADLKAGQIISDYNYDTANQN